MPFEIWLGTYYGGTQITASSIEYNGILDGKNILLFTVDDTSQLASLTQHADIYCDYHNGDTHQAIFQGFIEMVSTEFPYRVTCLGLLAKMEWYIVEEGNSKTFSDEGLIANINGGDNTRLDLTDLEGNAITDTSMYANPTNQNIYYLIVSDATRNTDTETLQNGANNYIGFGDSLDPAAWGTETNSYTAVDKANLPTDSTHWIVANTDDSLVYATSYRMKIDLDLVQYAIPKTVTLTNLSISGYAEVTMGSKLLYYNKTPLLVLVRTYGTTQGYWTYAQKSMTPAGLASKTVGFPFSFEIATPNFFTEGANYWEGGSIVIEFYWTKYPDDPSSTVPDTTISWQALQGTISYETATFDTLNHPINYTEVGDTIGTANNYLTSGVAAGDKWVIGVDYNVALQRAFSAQSPTTVPAINYDIHAGANVGVGVAKNFFGCTGFEMMEGLVKDINYHYWAIADPPLIRIGDPNDYANLNLLTPHLQSSATIERYCPAYICVVWKDGMEFAATGVSGATGVIKFQDQSILTSAEASRRATTYATRYAELTYTIELKYKGSPLVATAGAGIYQIPQIGNTFTVTISNQDGTTTEYAEQPARRVTIRNNGADEYYEIEMFLGLGSTPTFEKIPKEIEQLKRQNMFNQITTMSSTYTPATRHSALNGIAGSSEGYHLSAANYAAITNDTYDADKVDGADLETTWTDSDTKISSSKAMGTKFVAKDAANTVTDTFGLTPTTTNTNSIGRALVALAAIYSRIVQSDDDLTINALTARKSILLVSAGNSVADNGCVIENLTSSVGGIGSNLSIKDTTPYAANCGAGLSLLGYGNSTTKYAFGAIKANKLNATVDNYSSYLSFYARLSGASLTEVLRLATPVATPDSYVQITNGKAGTSSTIIESAGTANDLDLSSGAAKRVRIQVNKVTIADWTTTVNTNYQAVRARYSSDTVNPMIEFFRLRSTSPNAVAADDILGSLSWKGYDGANTIEGAKINAVVTGTPGTNDIPTSLRFYTTPDGSATPLEVLRLKTSVASAVNYAAITNSATGNPVIVSAEGTDTDINLLLQTKGAGHVYVKDEAGNWESIEADDFVNNSPKVYDAGLAELIAMTDVNDHKQLPIEVKRVYQDPIMRTEIQSKSVIDEETKEESVRDVEVQVIDHYEERVAESLGSAVQWLKRSLQQEHAEKIILEQRVQTLEHEQQLLKEAVELLSKLVIK